MTRIGADPEREAWSLVAISLGLYGIIARWVHGLPVVARFCGLLANTRTSSPLVGCSSIDRARRSAASLGERGDGHAASGPARPTNLH